MTLRHGSSTLEHYGEKVGNMMYRYFLVLVFCWALSFEQVICKYPLRKMMKINNEVSKNITSYEIENDKLKKEIDLEEWKFETSFNIKTKRIQSMDADVQSEIKSFEELIKSSTKIKSEEVKLIKDHDLKTLINLALTLKIKQVMEDIEVMERRRETGEAALCLRLHNVPQTRSLKVFSQLHLKNAIKENYRLLKFVKEENILLKRLLQELKAIHCKAMEDFNKILIKTEQKISEIKEVQKKVAGEMKRVKDHVVTLKKEISEFETNLSKSREILGILETNSKNYSEDRLCYADLEKMISTISPTPNGTR